MEIASIRVSRRALLKTLAPLTAMLAVSGMGRLWRGEHSAGAAQTGVAGRATEIISDRPVAGAAISVSPGDFQTTTAPDGRFQFTLPPGRYEVRINARGYIGMSETRQDVYSNQVTTVEFDLIPEGMSNTQQDAAQSKVLPEPANQTVPSAATQGDLERAVPQVNLPCQIWIQSPAGRLEMIDLEEYLKGVLPAEMPAYWPLEALKAQAVAARSYALAHIANNGYICTSTRCQAWQPTHYSTTDAAVDATRGVVATYNGNIAYAFFFSQCNGKTTRASEEAMNSGDSWGSCQTSPWNKLEYCRPRPCTGHAPAKSGCGYVGHGVGMCQHGARDRANAGKDYREIVNAYFTGITLQKPQTISLTYPADGQAVPGGAALAMRWTSGMQEYRASMLNAWGNVIGESPWQTAGGWNVTLPALPGTYYWFVRSRNSCGEGPTSELRRLTVTLPPRQVHVPLVDKSAVR